VGDPVGHLARRVFLINPFSGARKWLPGCPGGLSRYRFALPGSPGGFSPDPVCLTRESRRFFPGSGLPCPGVPAAFLRIRFVLSGSPGGLSPDPVWTVREWRRRWLAPAKRECPAWAGWGTGVPRRGCTKSVRSRVGNNPRDGVIVLNPRASAVRMRFSPAMSAAVDG